MSDKTFLRVWYFIAMITALVLAVLQSAGIPI